MLLPDGEPRMVSQVPCALAREEAQVRAVEEAEVRIREAAAQARAVCRDVVVGDLEAPATREDVRRAVGDGGVDVVLCADVLEHLRDPWDTLAWLRTLLAPGGRAVISVPNVAHWTARRELLRGRFPYAQHGLFDRTHLRFFTRESARELAHRAGFAVRREAPAPAPLPLESRVPALARVRDPCVRRCPELLALQFVLVLSPQGRP